METKSICCDADVQSLASGKECVECGNYWSDELLRDETDRTLIPFFALFGFIGIGIAYLLLKFTGKPFFDRNRRGKNHDGETE